MQMRTDATIDRKQVVCRNASTSGYSHVTARVGDWITWTDESGQTHVGRMIARIVYAPACGETPTLRNYIEALTLSVDLTHAFIRWVNPLQVSTVYRHRADIGAFLSFFAGKLPDRDVLADTKGANGTIEGMAAYGSLSADLSDPADSPIGTFSSFANKLTRYAEYRQRAEGAKATK